jgi:hypothetical protein
LKGRVEEEKLKRTRRLNVKKQKSCTARKRLARLCKKMKTEEGDEEDGDLLSLSLYRSIYLLIATEHMREETKQTKKNMSRTSRLAGYRLATFLLLSILEMQEVTIRMEPRARKSILRAGKEISRVANLRLTLNP